MSEMIVIRKIPSLYKFYADNRGRIWKIKKGKRVLQKTFIDSNGYQRVHLPDMKDQYRHFYVQRLVCEAFKGESTEIKPICLRQAPNQQPKRVRANAYLRWGTHSQIKRSVPKRLDIDTVINVRQDYKSGRYTQKQLAEKYNTTQPNISNIVTHRSYK
jgi:hypothetical protein